MLLFKVPEPPPYILANAPLVQALAQVRYPLVADFESLSGIAPLQRQLRGDFPYMQQERVHELSFVAGPAGPAADAAESSTWHLTNDGGTRLVIGAGSATLSVGVEYVGFSEFAGSFEKLLTALSKVGVPRCDRIGVRYLSIAADVPKNDRAWRRWFKPEFLGWPAADIISDHAAHSSINQVQLQRAPAGLPEHLPGNLQAVVRHGAVPPNTAVPGIPPLTVPSASYLIDLDVFVEGPQRFDIVQLMRQFRLFHGEIDSFFFWSLSDEGCKHFALEAQREEEDIVDAEIVEDEDIVHAEIVSYEADA